MRLRELGFVLALACSVAASAQPAAPGMTASAVRAAASAVREDPLLGEKEKTKTLQFKDDKKDPKAKKENASLAWWSDLVSNISGGMRVLIWIVLAGLLILVLLRLRDWLIERDKGPQTVTLRPSHVGTLDIRPESLPSDVGGAARALWQEGELRGALSLLYRGALSRLVHSHGVLIRSASTESDCLRLASTRLQPPSLDYLRQLIGCWQTAAYAQGQVLPDDMERLCADFDAQLPALNAGGSP